MNDSKGSIPYFSSNDLDNLNITTADVVGMLESLIKNGEDGLVWSAPKSVITPPDDRYIMSTLAVSSDPALVVSKSLVVNERNNEKDLPQINSLVSVLDGETGIPIAIMDGNWITAVRTAGLSALAAKYLAKEDAASVALIGCGVQARSHLNAFADLFPLQQVKVFGRGQKNLDRMRDLSEQLNLAFTICDSPKDAMENAELVVSTITHTAVKEPFLDASWLAPGAFAAIVDLAASWHKPSFELLDQLIVDDLEQELALPNKLANPDHITGDLTGLVTGKISRRVSTEDRNAFAFRGHALGDLAVAILALKK